MTLYQHLGAVEGACPVVFWATPGFCKHCSRDIPFGDGGGSLWFFEISDLRRWYLQIVTFESCDYIRLISGCSPLNL